jgi:hypothetical protein
VAFGTGHLLASASDDGTVRLWEATTGRPGPVLLAHEGGAFGVAFDPAGTTLATIGWDGAVRLWDATTGQAIRQLGTTVQRMSIRFGDALAFDRDGRRLAAASDDGTVRVWEIASGNEILVLRGHTREVNGVAYSPDGRRLVTGAADHTIKLWDAATGEEMFTLRGHTGGVLGLAFSPDGQRIISTGADGMVRAWDGAPQATGTLEDTTKPVGPDERIGMAVLLYFKGLNRAAARCYEEAFAADPKLANDLSASHRYNAACAAALSGTDQGTDADTLDGKERAHLRHQALDWLRADLEAWRRLLDKGPDNDRRIRIEKRMRLWLADTDLSGVRGAAALARLPEAERPAWQKLWDDVADTLACVQTKTTPEKKSGSK